MRRAMSSPCYPLQVPMHRGGCRRAGVLLLLVAILGGIAVIPSIVYEKSGANTVTYSRIAVQESEDLDDFVSLQWLKDNSLCFFTLLDAQASVASVAALSTWASLANSKVIVFVSSADILEASDELRELAATRRLLLSVVTDTAAPLHTLFEVAHTLYRARAYGYFDHNIAVGDGLVASLAAVDKGDLSSHQNVFVTATRRIISSANSVMRDIQALLRMPLRQSRYHIKKLASHAILYPNACQHSYVNVDVLIVLTGVIPTSVIRGCGARGFQVPLLHDAASMIVDVSLTVLLIALDDNSVYPDVRSWSLHPLVSPSLSYSVPSSWLNKLSLQPVVVWPSSLYTANINDAWKATALAQYGLIDDEFTLASVSAAPAAPVVVPSASAIVMPPPSPPPSTVPKAHTHTHNNNDHSIIVTMFVTMAAHPVGSQKYFIQINALRALKLLNQVEVVVFSKEEEIARLCASLGIEVTTEFATNPYGTPILRSMFKHVEHHAASRMVGYANSDILFCSELEHTLRGVLQAVEAGLVSSKVLVVGKRYNYKMPPDFTNTSSLAVRSTEDVDRVVHEMIPNAVPFQDDAQDFFVIIPGTFNWDTIPDFVVGRPAYDNWLVDYAFHNDIDSIDVSRTLHAIHQSGEDGDKSGHLPRIDKTWNLNLDRFREWYDHGKMSTCKFETREAQDGSIQLMKRSHMPIRPARQQIRTHTPK